MDDLPLLREVAATLGRLGAASPGRTAETLAAARALIERLAALVLDRSLVTDQAGIVRAVSPDAARLTGGDAADLLGRSLVDLVVDEDADHLRRALATFGAVPAGMVECAVRLRRAGRTTAVSLRGVLDPAGGRIHWTAGATGADPEAASRRRAAALEALSRAAARLTHDLNNRLAVCAGYAESLADTLPASHPLRPDIEEIRRAADGAVALARQIRAVSAGPIRGAEELDLRVAFAWIEDVLRDVAGEEVALEVGPVPPVRVRIDPRELVHAVAGLVVEARDAAPGGTRLTVHAVCVEDPGGPDREAGGRAERHVRIHIEGAGVPSPVGAPPGAIAAVHVALAEPDEAAPAVAGETVPGVLLVDDDAAVRRLMRTVLTDAGFVVLEAGGGREALRLADGHPGPIDVAVVDLEMPGVGGADLGPALLKVRPGLRLLYSSGYGQADRVRPGGGPTGPPGFLEKPFIPGVLVQRVRHALARPAPT